MTLWLGAGLIGLVIALIFFGGTLYAFGRACIRAHGSVQEVREAIDRCHARTAIMEKQRAEVLADIEARQARIAKLAADTTKLQEQSTGIITKASMVYYILSDRWTPADQEWIVPVRNLSMFGRSIHRGVIESWSEGRNYIVWAPRMDIVMRQVENKFPPTAGYLIGAPIPSPLKLAISWQAEATENN